MRVGGGLQANVALPQPVTDSDTDYDEAPIDEEYSGTGKIYENVVTRRRPIKPNLANFRVWRVIAKDWCDVEPIRIAQN